MANKAAQELQELLDMQTEAQDSAANLAKLTEARTQFTSGDLDQGSALPEALLTAVGIGWVLGPVGGLLIGAAQGILGHQQRKSALDNYLADMGILESTNNIFNDQFDRMELAATTPEDLAQISAMRTQHEIAMEYSTSPNDATAQKGAAMMDNLNTKMTDFGVKNEEQAVALKASDAQLQRDLEKETYAKHRGLLGDFQAESANFPMQQQTADNVLEALNRGDGASLTAALATMPLIINPQAGATTEAEVEIWQKVGGRLDALKGIVAKELGAGGLTDPTRKEIIGVTQQYKRNSIGSQQAIEAHYGEVLTAEKIPENLWPQYNMSGRMPVVRDGGFIKGADMTDESGIATAAGDAAEGTTSMIDQASMAIGDFFDNRKHEQAWREEYFRIHGTEPNRPLNTGAVPSD